MDPFAKALFDDLEDCRFRDPVGVVQTLRDAGVDKDNVTSYRARNEGHVPCVWNIPHNGDVYRRALEGSGEEVACLHGLTLYDP